MSINRQSAQDENATQISTQANLLRSVKIRQLTEDAPVLYLQVFNSASPTVGSTAPNIVIEVPAGISTSQVPLTVEFSGPNGGVFFDTGLATAVTTSPTNNTAPDAGDEPTVDVDYQEIG